MLNELKIEKNNTGYPTISFMDYNYSADNPICFTVAARQTLKKMLGHDYISM